MTAVLEILFSVIFYGYINYSVDSELRTSMLKQARYLFGTYDDVAQAISDKNGILEKTMKLKARIASLPEQHYSSFHFHQFREGNKFYLEAYFPYEFAGQRYLVLRSDVTKQKHTEQKVVHGIVFVSAFGLVGILAYAFLLSNILVAPIRVFSHKIAKINENRLTSIDTRGIPEEFVPLGQSVNNLINRIDGFVNYKKELFVGTAHELKTPLAVIKTKSQVAIMKRNKTEADLIDALKQNIRTVDDMNKIVGSILEFGRAEGAQFEKPEELDLIEMLRQMCDEFGMLSAKQAKHLKCRLYPERYIAKIPVLLLRQIVQNLLQNAIKFTPEGGNITVSTYLKNKQMHIIVRDSGCGIDEQMDLFAPFRRSAHSSGAGLGLFLVKSAADALGADISIGNRSDAQGVVAKLILPESFV